MLITIDIVTYLALPSLVKTPKINSTRGIAKKTTHPGCQAFKQKPNAKKETIASNGVTDEIFLLFYYAFFDGDNEYFLYFHR